jgi:hypothetical protein
MEHMMVIDILPQPDETTCGPTCLHAMYRYFGDDLPLEQVIDEIQRLDHGGTLAVFLACHALRRGYRAKIYTYNLQMFDPSWFVPEAVDDLRDRLRRQMKFRKKPAVDLATAGYLEFLTLGGKLEYEELTSGLIRRYLKRGIPILSGLSATYLYRTPREYGPESLYDDIRGKPSGHFVILGDYEPQTRSVLIIDPMHPNPLAPSQHYEINIDRVIGAILLGILTHDANLLIIEPARKSAPRRHVDTDRCQ